MKEWIRGTSLPSSVRFTPGLLNNSKSSKVDTSKPGSTKQGHWRYRLGQAVYAHGWGFESLTIVGGALDGPLGFPQYRLKDSRGREQVKLQIAISSKPIE